VTLKRIRVGIDVGGTFTDFVLVDELRDLIYTGKRLTTSHDPSEAIFAGLARLLREAGTDPDHCIAWCTARRSLPTRSSSAPARGSG